MQGKASSGQVIAGVWASRRQDVLQRFIVHDGWEPWR
jgi:hypothetical protein